MTPEQLKSKFPHASPSFIRINNSGLHTPEPKPVKKRALERPAPREETCGYRLEICFSIYSRRPLDWDNWRTKELQDLLIIIGAIPSDDWTTLKGRVESHKVHRAEEEKTVVTVHLAI